MRDSEQNRRRKERDGTGLILPAAGSVAGGRGAEDLMDRGEEADCEGIERRRWLPAPVGQVDWE